MRKLHAVVEVVKKWHQYLLRSHFVIQTDHGSLKDLLTQVIQTPKQHKYLTKLLGYDYSILYKDMKDNVVADCLSRQHDNIFYHLAYSMP